MNDYSKFAAMISSEFSKYVIENEGFTDKIPPKALVIFQVKGEDGFNKWHKNISLKNVDTGQPIIYVNVIKWRRRSAIENLTISEV